MSYNEEDVDYSESSPEPQEQEQTTSPDTDEAPEPVAAAPTPKAEPAPFHEHPRFKEVIEQKNTFARQLEEQGRQFAEMQKRLEQYEKAQRPDPRAGIKERLKGIDPEFADYVSKVDSVDALTEKLEKFEQWQQQQEQQALRKEAVSTRDSYWNQMKVPEADRDLYNDILTAKASSISDIKELPGLLKQVHEMLSKRFQSVQRETTKQLVESKKQDASRPTSQPRGQNVKPGQKAEYSKNPNEAKAQVVKDIVAEIRAGKDI